MEYEFLKVYENEKLTGIVNSTYIEIPSETTKYPVDIHEYSERALMSGMISDTIDKITLKKADYYKHINDFNFYLKNNEYKNIFISYCLYNYIQEHFGIYMKEDSTNLSGITKITETNIFNKDCYIHMCCSYDTYKIILFNDININHVLKPDRIEMSLDYTFNTKSKVIEYVNEKSSNYGYYIKQKRKNILDGI